MKNNIDLYSVCVGVMAAVMKGIKHKLDMRTFILGIVIAALLSFLTIGLLDWFIADLPPRVVILVSFCVGWVANELTDILDQFVKDGYEIGKIWATEKFGKKKKDEKAD